MYLCLCVYEPWPSNPPEQKPLPSKKLPFPNVKTFTFSNLHRRIEHGFHPFVAHIYFPFDLLTLSRSFAQNRTSIPNTQYSETRPTPREPPPPNQHPRFQNKKTPTDPPKHPNPTLSTAQRSPAYQAFHKKAYNLQWWGRTAQRNQMSRIVMMTSLL